ncbi:MAG: SDR family oxidoreductase [Coxiellaceae bacterium]|nr:SDR family oxidoreductase [Coxiellaceae bacterium]
MNKKNNTVIIGATSAIAQAIAKQLASAGHQLFLVARNAAHMQTLADDVAIRSQQPCQTFAFDAKSNELYKDCLEQATLALGQIDNVVIAHGTLPNQEDCQQNLAATLQEFQVNATSYIGLMTVFGQHLEQQGAGHLVVFSSCAGDRGRQSNYLYGATKAAISAFSAGLRSRLFKKGISVLTVKPGFVDTPMTQAFKKGFLWAQPDDVAKRVIQAMQNNKAIVYVPGFWRYIMMIIKCIPESLMKRIAL